jgi:uncharacterized protein
MNPFDIIEKYYKKNSELYTILVQHSNQVRLKSLEIVDKHPELMADRDFVSEAAMMHDIGIFMTDAPSIACFGTHHYIEHGYLGAELLIKEGFPKHALVAERHTGTGLSLAAIVRQNLPVPHREMAPKSIEEEIICYADNFYSKTKIGKEHSVEKIIQNLQRFGDEQVQKFKEWNQKFS